MLTREELKKLRYYDRCIAECKERQADIRMRARGIGVSLSDMPRNRKHADKMAEFMVQLEKLEEETERYVLDAIKLENKAREEISRLPEQQANVMHARYLEINRKHSRRLSWTEVARSTNYSVSHCKVIHRKALENLLK